MKYLGYIANSSIAHVLKTCLVFFPAYLQFSDFGSCTEQSAAFSKSLPVIQDDAKACEYVCRKRCIWRSVHTSALPFPKATFSIHVLGMVLSKRTARSVSTNWCGIHPYTRYIPKSNHIAHDDGPSANTQTKKNIHSYVYLRLPARHITTLFYCINDFLLVRGSAWILLCIISAVALSIDCVARMERNKKSVFSVLRRWPKKKNREKKKNRNTALMLLMTTRPIIIDYMWFYWFGKLKTKTFRRSM